MFKKLITTSIILLLLMIGIPTIVVLSHYRDTTTATKDCAVVFGAAVWRDDQPSHALYDRTVTGIDLYHNEQVQCIVLSGGPSTYGAHEVAVMQQLALERGVPNTALTLDHDGINTLATIEDLDPTKSYIFVSNDFHLARIQMLAKKNGITNFDLHQATYHFNRYTREPRFFIREVAGVLYYFFNFDKLPLVSQWRFTWSI